MPRQEDGVDCPTTERMGQPETTPGVAKTKDQTTDQTNVGLRPTTHVTENLCPTANVITVQPRIVTGPVYPTDLSRCTICPPGLEVLLDTARLVIHKANLRQKVVIREDAVSRSEVIDDMRHILFYVEQDLPPNGEDSFMFHVYNREKNEVAQVYNPLSGECVCGGATCHWFKNCKFRAIVYAPPGVIVGFIRRSYTVFVQEYQVLSPREELLLVLRGGPGDLEIYTPDFTGEIGVLSVQGWSGVMAENRRSTQDYGLTFPLDLDVDVKLVLLTAVYALDWVCGPKPPAKMAETTHQDTGQDKSCLHSCPIVSICQNA